MRLAGDDHAVGELLPAGRPSGAGHGPRAARGRRPRHGELGARRDRGAQPDRAGATPRWVQRATAAPVDAHLVTRRPCRSSTQLGAVARRPSAAARARRRGGCRRPCSAGRGRSARRVEPDVAVAGQVVGSVARLTRVLRPRADRVADPARLVGHGLAAHHQRHRADGRVPAERRRRQDHAVRARAFAPSARVTRVHAQDAVVEQVGLHDAAPVDGGAVRAGR